MPHRLCISRLMLCNNFESNSFQFNLQSFIHSSQNCNHHLHLQFIWQLITTNIHKIIYNQCINNSRLYSLIKALVHFKLKINCPWYCLTLSRQFLFLEMIISFATYSMLLNMSLVCNHCVSFMSCNVQ